MFRGSSLMKALGGVALALALVMPAEVFAQGEPPALKVGVFNADRILAETTAGQQVNAQLEQLQNLRVSELQAQQGQLNAIQQRGLTASPDSSVYFQRVFQDRQLQMQRLQEDVQAELQARQQQLTGPIIEQIAEFIERIGAEENFTMIFNALQSGLVYVDESIDLTDRIIAEINAVSAAPGGD